MTTNAPKSPLPQFVCQVCGGFLQQDSSLDTIDEQMIKPIASSATICDESYNELQQGGSDGTIVIRKTLGRKRLSQSSLDSTNGFAFVAHDLNKDIEQKSMREYRIDINIHERLYDFLSEQYTFDHPLCQECTDTLLDKLDVDLQMATHELTSYKKLLEQLNLSANGQQENYEKLKQELIELDKEEERIKNELLKLEQENERLQNESEQLTKEEQSLEQEEIRYLRDYNEQKRLLFEAEDEQKSIDNQTKHARAQYEKLSKTNAFNAAFHIWHQEHFGTINGFRLGRLPSINVEWSEINAALGQAALLLNALAKRVDLQFAKYKIIPLGSHSYIEDLNESKNGKFVQLPLYTGRRRLTWDTPFDKALIAFLDCVNQFKLAIESKNQRFCLPYKMNEKQKGVITDSNGHQFHVIYQVSKQEEWTKALKYMLTNLKWGLTWITSQLPDDMTTSNAIPSPSSPTVTSPR
ncbi:unnamed protein product [Rotaria sp. Silwood1]|nr:unnamed protein product [Rotaria sp. Silwood1]CAF0751624.1 unnamed protein product [Rotaria sp. Silwood1]CAF3362412.1 unnamed protein product [Rotaria sp. Silwood1]CAF4558027.1 unnamed protein product [Rotaria sp. Silwood1]CAF4560137.1 unnamed protein product [Rotaria sp. Silwood1]